MNYLKLINSFWQNDFEHHFTPNDTRLYFFLLHTCNQLGWKMPFGHSDRHLSYKLGVAVNTIRDCKERLKQRGLIDFTVPEKKSKSYEGQTRYTICAPTVSNFETDTDTVVGTVTGTDGGAVGSTDGDTNNKPKRKPKPNKKEYRDNIRLTEEENSRLVAEYGQTFVDACYDYLSSWKKEKGKSSKDDNLTIRRWVVDAVSKKQPTAPVVQMPQHEKLKKAANWTPDEKDSW